MVPGADVTFPTHPSIDGRCIGGDPEVGPGVLPGVEPGILEDKPGGFPGVRALERDTLRAVLVGPVQRGGGIMRVVLDAEASPVPSTYSTSTDTSIVRAHLKLSSIWK